jgi:6-phosphofructokinase 1
VPKTVDKRPADHRLLPGLRLGRQVRRRVGARGVARRPLDGTHVDQGLRPRGHGAPCRLDRRRRRLIEEHGIPVVILFPEIEFDEAKFIARVDSLVKEHGYCTVVVSEGAHRADGTFLAEQGTRDAFGHAQLGGAAPVVANMVKTALGHKFHWAVADYLQRAARHIASKTDVRQAYELGKRAVELALKGRNAVMPTIERTSDVPYRYRIGVADLADVANVEKFMPRDFISADGFSITEKCRRYLRPLIAGEDYPAYRGGLPVYATLKNVAVAPRLAPFALQ